MTPIPLGFLDFPSAGGPGFELIGTETLTSDSAGFLFSGLSNLNYNHLQIRWSAKVRDNSTGVGRNLYMQANGNTGSVYAYHAFRWSSNSYGSNGYAASSTYIQVEDVFPRSSASYNNQWSSCLIDITDYNHPDKNSVFRILTADMGNSFGNWASGLYAQKTPMDTLLIYSDYDFVSGSSFSIYGRG